MCSFKVPSYLSIHRLNLFALCSICYCTDERDWKKLLPDLMSTVANLALRSDVTHYIRLRAVCNPWRSAAKADPNLMGMDPRFFPRNWVMVPQGEERREKAMFINGLTGASMQLQIPREYGHAIASAEGCLLLAFNQELRLFNPVTRVVADLPPPFTDDEGYPDAGNQLISNLHNVAGILYDGDVEADAAPTVVLSMPLGSGTMLMYAKPGDHEWEVDAVEEEEGGFAGGLAMWAGGLSVRGSFYVPTCTGDLLKLKLQPRPRLSYVARQDARHRCDRFGVTSFLVPSYDDADDGMLLIRSFASIGGDTNWFRVNLREGRLAMLQDEEIPNQGIYSRIVDSWPAY
jgi:hypothetical protein